MSATALDLVAIKTDVTNYAPSFRVLVGLGNVLYVGDAPTAHNHVATEITSGTLPVARLAFTKAELDTMVSDGNVAYQSDLTSYLTTAAIAAAYQPLDGDLTSIAALATQPFGRSLLTQVDAAATRATIGVGIGDMVAANNLSDLISAPTSRTNLGLGTLATQSGTFSGTSSGTNTGDQTNITGNAATVTTNANLTGDVTSVGNATTLTNAPVIAKVLTGYTSNAGTVASTDSILQAIQKLNGNDATNANLTGHVTSVGNAAVLGSFTKAQLDAAVSDGNVLYVGDAPTTHVHSGADITSGTVPPAQLGSGASITTKYLRGDSTWQAISGGGDALISGTLDQFADVTQTALATLAISASTTLSGGTHSGTNTGDNATNSQYSGLVSNATHTGDATGATVLTIAAGVVTLAKMADMATSSLIYRKTASTGAPEVNTLATLKTDLGLTGTNSGDQTITLTGMVTGSGTGSFTASLGSFTKTQLDTAVSDGNVLYVGDTIPVATGISGLGTGVATALAINVGSAGAVVTTSSTDTLTNKTLTSPTMTAPVLGVASATTVNKVTITQPATGATLTIADGATLTASATASVSGTNTGDNATNTQYSGLVSNANHSGDATGATVLTLATVNSNVGSFGSTTQASVITVNAKGLVTAASNSTVTPAVGSITGLGTGVTTALGLAITAAASTVLDDTTVSAMIDTLGGASATGTGGIVRGTSPTIATPVINGLPTGTGVATANTASTLVARDASGNFTAGTITAALTGTASGNMPLAGGTFTSGVKHTLGTYTPTGTTQTIDLNAGNITKLSLASASGNVTLTLTVPTSGTMQGTILALNGSTARNLIIAASDSSTIKFLCTKIDTSTDTASTRRAYTWMWDGTNLNVLQSEMSTT